MCHSTYQATKKNDVLPHVQSELIRLATIVIPMADDENLWKSCFVEPVFSSSFEKG